MFKRDLTKNNLIPTLSKVNTPYQTPKNYPLFSSQNFKFTGRIPYKRIVETGLGDLKLDLKSWLILDYIKDWFFSNSKRKKVIIENGDTFVWINYRYMIKSLPTLHLTKPTISRRIKKLETLGFIKTKRINGKALYVSLTKLSIEIYRCDGLKQGVSLVKRSTFSNKDLTSTPRPITKELITININNTTNENKDKVDTIARKISFSKTSSPLKEDTELDILLSKIAKKFNFNLNEIKMSAQEKLEKERTLYWNKMKANPNRVSLKEIQKTFVLLNEENYNKSQNKEQIFDFIKYPSFKNINKNINFSNCEETYFLGNVINELLAKFSLYNEVQ